MRHRWLYAGISSGTLPLWDQKRDHLGRSSAPLATGTRHQASCLQFQVLGARRTARIEAASGLAAQATPVSRLRGTAGTRPSPGRCEKARDTKLDRDVALKILPEAFVNDTERLARFQRETKVLASLNHPNIAAEVVVQKSPPRVNAISRRPVSFPSLEVPGAGGLLRLVQGRGATTAAGSPGRTRTGFRRKRASSTSMPTISSWSTCPTGTTRALTAGVGYRCEAMPPQGS